MFVCPTRYPELRFYVCCHPDLIVANDSFCELHKYWWEKPQPWALKNGAKCQNDLDDLKRWT